MAAKLPLEQVEGESSNIGVFEEAVAKAEKLGKAAREAADASTKTSQAALLAKCKLLRNVVFERKCVKTITD